MSKRERVQHARSHLYLTTGVGAWAADKLTTFTGSWWFVGLHVLWFSVWFLLRIEPFPFGFLTLCVSLEAIFLSTFVMISQNRQASRDRKRDDMEAFEVEKLVQEQEVVKEAQEEIKHINLQQSEMLREQKQSLEQQAEMLTLLKTLIEQRKAQKKSPV